MIRLAAPLGVLAAPSLGSFGDFTAQRKSIHLIQKEGIHFPEQWGKTTFGAFLEHTVLLWSCACTVCSPVRLFQIQSHDFVRGGSEWKIPDCTYRQTPPQSSLVWLSYMSKSKSIAFSITYVFNWLCFELLVVNYTFHQETKWRNHDCYLHCIPLRSWRNMKYKLNIHNWYCLKKYWRRAIIV